ncbi:hypothetical protein F5Y17DRAFT_435578 [Xylariaceae sp. FL0594]|nr:hypothetical protein F5Y17DRAFT_435578 [Xylariaceae sp. FL0594]
MATTTMTMTLSPTPEAPAPPPKDKNSLSEPTCCPNCGLSLPRAPTDSDVLLKNARRQIEDLQSQVRLLNQKAAAAVDRWADYEDELSRLRAASTSTNNSSTTSITTTTAATTHTRGNSNAPKNNDNTSSNNRPHTPDASVGASSQRSSFLGAGASRISQLLSLSPRKSALAHSINNIAHMNPTTTTTISSPIPIPTTTAASISTPSLPLPDSGTLNNNDSNNNRESADTAMITRQAARELASALAHERRLRLAAEEKLAATGREIEDLSASLFEQANGMVAAERRARAALEEQLGVLRARDVEKGARLERLEGAVRVIERARALVVEYVVTGAGKAGTEERERRGGSELRRSVVGEKGAGNVDDGAEAETEENREQVKGTVGGGGHDKPGDRDENAVERIPQQQQHRQPQAKTIATTTTTERSSKDGG